jgi:branched-subunit amino acid permease
MENALRYASVIAWILAVGAACFTAGLLIGRSAAEGGNYGIYVLVSTVVTTAALVTAISLTIATANKLRQRRSRS